MHWTEKIRKPNITQKGGGVGKHLVHGTGEVLSTTAKATVETAGHTLRAAGHAGQAAIDGMKETGELLAGTNRQGKNNTKV